MALVLASQVNMSLIQRPGRQTYGIAGQGGAVPERTAVFVRFDDVQRESCSSLWSISDCTRTSVVQLVRQPQLRPRAVNYLPWTPHRTVSEVSPAVTSSLALEGHRDGHRLRQPP
jgi:hypothetical protein